MRGHEHEDLLGNAHLIREAQEYDNASFVREYAEDAQDLIRRLTAALEAVPAVLVTTTREALIEGIRRKYSESPPSRYPTEAALAEALLAPGGPVTLAETTSGWVPAKWHEVAADSEDGTVKGDTIRLTWEDGTVLVGRLTVPSRGAGHHQIARMMTTFGGDTYVWPHGSTLERKAS